MSYDNPWVQLEVADFKFGWGLKLPPSFSSVSYEYLLPNGKISPVASLPWIDGKRDPSIVYADGQYFSVDQVKVRYEDTRFQKIRALLDLIQIGDFVKAKSRAGDYRKVLKIDPRGLIYGQAYKQPIDDPAHARLVSSENCMLSVTRVYRNGEQIWPKK